MAELRQRLRDDMNVAVQEMFGLPEPLREERVRLEAVDAEGNVIEAPVVVQTRKLRSLTAPDVSRKTFRLLSEDGLALELYEGIPEPIEPEQSMRFLRAYTGDDAEAIAMEARLIVTLKGGEWAEPEGDKPAGNAIAVRGLDLSKGLVNNSNKTYDDTMYVVVERSIGPTEVFEYRATTESSSEKRGVGRLKAKQVIYYRGLHRGKDPAYRLVGNVAEGTRSGLEGEYEITGANIHSAYTSRAIDSSTPLSPNVSLGCQVVAASKGDFEQSMVFMLDKKGVKRFPYTIVDDGEVAELDRILQRQGKESVLVRALPR